MKGLLLDAGHGLGPSGAEDNGVSGGGTTEREQVIAIAQQLLPLLQWLPLKVVPIGVTERLSVVQKTQKINDACHANGWGASDALLVSLHMNQGPAGARGLEAWYGTGKEPGQVFGDTLIRSVAAETGLPLRAVVTNPSNTDRLGRLGILDDTIPTSCLLELGFISNKFDLTTVLRHTSVVLGIYKGLLRFLDLPIPPMDAYLDVPEGTWFTDAVKQCLDEGIFQMPDDRLFHPDRAATRAELAVMFARLLHKP